MTRPFFFFWFALALCFLHALAGCASFTDYVDHGIPNLAQVDANVWRGGQPQGVDACRYLHDVLHVTKWVKWSYEREGESKTCASVGIEVLNFSMPPSDARDFIERPAHDVVQAGVAALLACRANHEVCFEGCLYGRDRTGLMTSLYVWLSGQASKPDAWKKNAAARGFRVIFHELSDVYDDWR